MTPGTRRRRIAWAVATLAGSLQGVRPADAVEGGLFFPRNGGLEGRIGQAHLYVDATAGGAMEIVTGEWPKLVPSARLAAVFKLKDPGSAAPVDVTQELDRSPELIPIEEGNQRIGLRVKFRLYDAERRYRGHGITETWAYPNGEIFVTVAASFEGMSPFRSDSTNTVPVGTATARMLTTVPSDPDAREAVTEAEFRLTVAPALEDLSMGGETFKRSAPAVSRPFTNAAPEGRMILAGSPEHPALTLYWRSGNLGYKNFIARKQGVAPYYYRWPAFLPQAYSGPTFKSVSLGDGAVGLRWLDGTPAAKPNPTFVGLFRLTVPSSTAEAERLAAADRSPVLLGVTNGVLQGNQDGYNDAEGVYEVRKTDDPVRILLPADPTGRTVRVKVICLSGHGGITATLDGQPVVPHLAAEGGIADDPLAPIREQPEGPADMALLTVPLTNSARVLEVAEVPGVQLAYQTRDRWRSFACFSTRGGDRYPGFRFSPVDGRARNMRGYGQREWALTENLLTWFSFCGFTPEQIADSLVDFVIEKNGPDEVVFRYISRNATDRVQSDYRVRVPADSPAMQMNVAATFTVLESWPYTGCQFFDVFPFRGVWTQDWWYQEALWVAPDGRTKWWPITGGPAAGDKDLETWAGGGFFSLYGADRGNMLMMTHDFEPALPVKYNICGNYTDWHMTLEFLGEDGKPRPPAKGFTATCHYDLAVWGDARTGRDQLTEIGRKSLKAGRLELPAR